MVRPLSDYILFRATREKAEPYHALVVEFHDNLFKDEDLQDILLSDIEGEIKSFYDIGSQVWIRKKTLAHSIYLDYMIQQVTQPTVVGVEIPLNELCAHLRTSEGYSAEVIERMQRQWFKNPIVPIIREYQSILKEAFDNFNLQLVLSLIDQARQHFYLEREDTKGYRRRIEQVFDPDVHTALDNAYYIKGRNRFEAAGRLWVALNADEYGRNFRLTQEEGRQFLTRH